MKESEALLILNAIDGLGNARIKKLIEFYGCASKVLSQNQAELLADRVVPSSVIENIIHFSQDKFLKSEYNLINEYGARVIIWGSKDYPPLLAQIPDAPVVLYTKGVLSLEDLIGIGVVGSRRASIYGLTVAERFASQLAEKGITIVSGLARGIDTAAHKGVLKVKGKTIAVLGCGFSHVYPPENGNLYQSIAENGLIISEFPFQKPPVAYNFPRRNRIISGLSQGIVVVEAANRSGALITADFALEQGREVYAVPGPIDRMSASGVNHLIQQGAKLITQVDDILEDLALVPRGIVFDIDEQINIDGKISDLKLTDKEQHIYQYISERPVHVDMLTAKMDNDVSLTHQLLLQLELKHLVKQLPGKNFKRTR